MGWRIVAKSAPNLQGGSFPLVVDVIDDQMSFARFVDQVRDVFLKEEISNELTSFGVLFSVVELVDLSDFDRQDFDKPIEICVLC